jgi:hypothetical protein
MNSSPHRTSVDTSSGTPVATPGRTPAWTSSGSPARTPCRNSTPAWTSVESPAQTPCRNSTPAWTSVGSPAQTPCRNSTPAWTSVGSPARAPCRNSTARLCVKVITSFIQRHKVHFPGRLGYQNIFQSDLILTSSFLLGDAAPVDRILLSFSPRPSG